MAQPAKDSDGLLVNVARTLGSAAGRVAAKANEMKKNVEQFAGMEMKAAAAPGVKRAGKKRKARAPLRRKTAVKKSASGKTGARKMAPRKPAPRQKSSARKSPRR
jgi:hypothetical protein